MTQPQPTADPFCPKCHGQGGYVENPECIGDPKCQPVYVLCDCRQPTAALSDAEVLDKFQRTIGDFWVKGPDVSTAHEIQRLRSLLEFRLARAESAPGVSRERLAQIIQPFTPSYIMASKCADAVLAALTDAGTGAE